MKNVRLYCSSSGSGRDSPSECLVVCPQISKEIGKSLGTLIVRARLLQLQQAREECVENLLSMLNDPSLHLFPAFEIMQYKWILHADL